MLDDAPDSWASQSTVCECMNGKVWACFRGAIVARVAKANSSLEPAPKMTQFCEHHPNADVTPAAVTGRETIAEWRCVDGTSQIVRQLRRIGSRRFIGDYWVGLSDL